MEKVALSLKYFNNKGEAPMKFNWKNEVIFVTGASSGLGKALALRAGELNATVISIARNEEVLKEVTNEINRSGGSGYYYCFDLGNASQIPAFYKEIVQEVGSPPTILINNVGYQVAGFVQNTPIEVYEKNYRVNTLAPIALIQCMLPDMIKRNKGVIANVMSSIMYHAFPGVSSYCASKCALGAIHESLKSELSGTNVKTLRIRPGSFRSNYWKNTDVNGRIRDFKLPSSDEQRDPSFVAAKICGAIEKGDSEINLSTVKDKIGYHLSYWAPGILDRIIVDKNQNLVKKYPDKKVAMANY
jgi:uncharacterized protein